MSIRPATMSNTYSPATRRPGFLRKLVLTFLFVIAIAASMAWLVSYQKNLSEIWMIALATLSIGLASGTASRTTFYHWSGFTRFLVTLLVLPVGLFTLGGLTNWQLGIGPLNPWAKGIIPQDELIQLGGALLVAFISLEAWWKPRAKLVEMQDARGSSARRDQTPSTTFMPRSSPSQARFTFLPGRNSHPSFSNRNSTRVRTTSVADKLVVRHTAQPVRSRFRRLFNRKPNLQLSLYEEHRCPFCLEEVKRNDPRGVKKCEVCNTLHHADCWAVTGMCQVPHLNS